MAETRSAEIRLFDDFRVGWRSQWREQRLFAKPTDYRVVQDGEAHVLQAVSHGSNSGLLREVLIRAPEALQLRWRWKVRRPLLENHRERERGGDDFVARVVVVFETSVLPLRTRAINYVWAAHLPPEALYPSPYSANVAMMVLQSGQQHAGQWRAEARDVMDDYKRFFGRTPERISAVGLVVDTDNTAGNAEAWFADFMLSVAATLSGNNPATAPSEKR